MEITQLSHVRESIFKRYNILYKNPLKAPYLNNKTSSDLLTIFFHGILLSFWRIFFSISLIPDWTAADRSGLQSAGFLKFTAIEKVSNEIQTFANEVDFNYFRTFTKFNDYSSDHFRISQFSFGFSNFFLPFYIFPGFFIQNSWRYSYLFVGKNIAYSNESLFCCTFQWIKMCAKRRFISNL